MSLLQVENLTASYGPVPALFGVNLELRAGEVVALMGRNGMGKSTTVKAICRMIGAEGVLRFADKELHGLPSHAVARLGIGLVPEGRRCFRDLTVEENLIAAARPGPWDRKSVAGLLPRLEERRTQRAALLSGGEQQMLAIGRALMTNPQLLILDEATEGLAPIVRQEIWAAITRIKAETGMAILLIDKSLRELSSVSDHAVILARGKTVWSGKMTELTPEIKQDYVGGLMPFEMRQNVLFKHCDPAGIVFYPRYFEMMNDCVEAFFDEVLGHSFETLHKTGAVPTAHIETRFTAPSRHGDQLMLRLHVSNRGRTSMSYKMTAHATDELRFETSATLVNVDESGRPTPWPINIAGKLKELEEAADAP